MHRITTHYYTAPDFIIPSADGSDYIRALLHKLTSDQDKIWDAVMDHANQNAGIYVAHYLTYTFTPNKKQAWVGFTHGSIDVNLNIIME